MRFDIDTDEDVTIEHGRAKNTLVFDADAREVLDHFETSDIVAHFGTEELLDAIGQSAAAEHFGLED